MKTASSSSVAGAGRGPAAASGTLRLRVAEPSEHAEFDQLLSGHHRLGSTRAVGDFLRVWVDLEGERVALLAWGPACYALRERDRWIGWTPTQRAERLKLVVQLRRFALLSAPGERPNLASRVLGAALKAVPEQWRAEFGYVPLLAETFSDAEAQAGTVYRATGWEPLGMSQGFRRHRQDFYVRGEGLKRLWAKPLRRGAVERLRAQELPPEHRPGAGSSAHGVMPLGREDMLSLYDVLRKVPDPRRSNRTFRTGQVLAVVVMALLSGCRQVAQIHRFGTRLTQDQRKALGMPRKGEFRRVPGYKVYYLLLRRMDPADLAGAINAWLASRRGSLPAALALDGKAVRDLAGVVCLCDHETGAPAAMMPSPGKAGGAEARIGREAAAVLGDLSGTLVTADALHAEAGFAHAVAGAGGDYLVQAKGNRPGLRKALRKATAAEPPLLPASRRATDG